MRHTSDTARRRLVSLEQLETRALLAPIGDFSASSVLPSAALTEDQPAFQFHDHTLTVHGTNGPDTIKVLRSSRGWQVRTNFGTHFVPKSDALAKIVVMAGNGDDSVHLAALRWGEDAEVDGGGGNDTITGGGGKDVLLGGAGNDVLKAGGGDNVLVGGAGTDSLTGSPAADILIREFDTGDADTRFFREILDKWLWHCPADEKQTVVAALPSMIRADGADVIFEGGGPDFVM